MRSGAFPADGRRRAVIPVRAREPRRPEHVPGSMPLCPRFARWLPSPMLAIALALASVPTGCTSHGPEPLELEPYEPDPSRARLDADTHPYPVAEPPSGLMVPATVRRNAHRSVVRMQRPMVHGPLDEDVVRRIVRGHLDDVHACYERGLARNPALEGHVAVLFAIDPRGEVASAEVDATSLSDGYVAPCIATTVSGWRFARPRGGSTAAVRYPFVLAPPPGAS